MRYRRLLVEGATYFFTIVTEKRRPIFREPRNVTLLNEALNKVRSRHPFDVEAQVVLPDHVHAMWTLHRLDTRYSMRIGLIKEAFTRAYLSGHAAPFVSETRRSRRERGVWQSRFWEHVIQDDRDFSTHLDYIHLNPVHHGLALTPQDWPHSTLADWVRRGVYEPGWGSDVKPELPEWAKRFE